MLSPASESSFGRLHLYHEERKGGGEKDGKEEKNKKDPLPFLIPIGRHIKRDRGIWGRAFKGSRILLSFELCV